MHKCIAFSDLCIFSLAVRYSAFPRCCAILLLLARAAGNAFGCISLCVCVTFECLDLETLLLLCRYTLITSRSRSSIKVMDSRSRLYERNQIHADGLLSTDRQPCLNFFFCSFKYLFVSFFRRTCIKILEPFKLNQLPNGKSSNRYYNCTNTNSAGGIHIFYKSGDVTDINNYRAIALSSCLSKSFDLLQVI